MMEQVNFGTWIILGHKVISRNSHLSALLPPSASGASTQNQHHSSWPPQPTSSMVRGLGPFACFMIIIASLVVENCVHISPQLVRHWRFDFTICKVGNKIVLKKANSNPGTLQPGSSWQENITVTIQQQPHSFSNQVDICALNNILQPFPTASTTTPCAWHGCRAGRRGWSSRRWRRRWKWRWRPGARDRVECYPQHQPWA